MGIQDFEASLDMEMEEQRKRAAASANLINTYGTNPQDYAQRIKMQQSTGIPAVTMDDPTVHEDAKKQYFLNGMAVSHQPGTTKYLTAPENAGVSSNDVHNLNDMEGKLSATKVIANHISEATQFYRNVIKPTPQRAYANFMGIGAGINQFLGESVLQPFIDVLTTEDMKEKYGRSNVLTNIGVS